MDFPIFVREKGKGRLHVQQLLMGCELLVGWYSREAVQLAQAAGARAMEVPAAQCPAKLRRPSG